MALPVTISSSAFPNQNYFLGPFLNGTDVYWVGIETTGNTPEVWKATDPTSSFTAQDTGNNPTVSPLSMWAEQDGTDLKIVTQNNASNKGDVHYHEFDMSTDTWTTTQQQVHNNPGINADASASCAIGLRSDTDRVVLYNGPTEKVNKVEYDRVEYARWESPSWTNGVSVSPTAVERHHYGASMVMGESDKAHFFYMDDQNNDLHHRSLDSANSLGTEHTVDALIHIADKHIAVKPVYYDDGGVERITVAYRNSLGDFESAVVEDDGTPGGNKIINDSEAVSSVGGGPVGCLGLENGTTKKVHAMWVQDVNDDIYRDENTDEGGWGTDTAVFTGFVLGLTCAVYNRSGLKLAFVYDDNGTIQYDEVDLAAGADVFGVATALGKGLVVAAAGLDLAPASATILGKGLVVADAGVEIAASATATGSGLVDATASKDAAASASVTGSGLVAATARLDLGGIVTALGKGLVAATAVLTLGGISTATGAGLVDATGTVAGIQLGVATATGVGLTDAPARLDLGGISTATGVGLTNAPARMDFGGAASITGVGLVNASALIDRLASAIALGKGLTDAPARMDFGAVATILGRGLVDATGSVAGVQLGIATATGVGLVDALASADRLATAIVLGRGLIVATPSVDRLAIATILGRGLVVATASKDVAAIATALGVGLVDATGRLDLGAIATVLGIGDTTAIAVLDLGGQTTVVGVGLVDATGTVVSGGEQLGIATATGVGLTQAIASADRLASAIALGRGLVDAIGTREQLAIATALGRGLVVAIGSKDVPGLSTATGIGLVDASALINRLASASATGVGSISASAILDRLAIATALGRGLIVADPRMDLRAIATVLGRGLVVAVGAIEEFVAFVLSDDPVLTALVLSNDPTTSLATSGHPEINGDTVMDLFLDNDNHYLLPSVRDKDGNLFTGAATMSWQLVGRTDLTVIDPPGTKPMTFVASGDFEISLDKLEVPSASITPGIYRVRQFGAEGGKDFDRMDYVTIKVRVGA